MRSVTRGQRRPGRAVDDVDDRELAHRDPANLELMALRGDETGLARWAIAGDLNAAERLARLLVKRGDEAEPTRCADAGDQHAAGQLARLQASRGEVDELTRRAEAGQRDAAEQLIRLLAERAKWRS